MEFASGFRRRSFEAICDGSMAHRFGQAMKRFAQMATMACFDLNGLRPVGGNPHLIEVKRSSQGNFSDGSLELEMTEPGAHKPGWYYEKDENKICLTQIPRQVGDFYEISILDTDTAIYNQ